MRQFKCILRSIEETNAPIAAEWEQADTVQGANEDRAAEQVAEENWIDHAGPLRDVVVYLQDEAGKVTAWDVVAHASVEFYAHRRES